MNKYSKIIIILVILLSLLGLLFILEKTRVTNFIQLHPSSENKLTPEQEKAQNDANIESKKNFIENEQAETPPPSQETSSVTVTATQLSSSSVTVLTKLLGYPDGTCELSVTNGSKSFSQSAPIIYQPDFSSCAGFSVPIDQLGTGSWSVELSATYHDIQHKDTVSLEVR